MEVDNNTYTLTSGEVLKHHICKNERLLRNRPRMVTVESGPFAMLVVFDPETRLPVTIVQIRNCPYCGELLMPDEGLLS